MLAVVFRGDTHHVVCDIDCEDGSNRYSDGVDLEYRVDGEVWGG